MPERNNDEIRARAFWSGTISFGLVSIPVDLFPANRKERVSLRMLGPDGTPLARRYYCPEEDREVPYSEIARGYQVGRKFVMMTDEDLEAVEPRKSREIDLRLFVDREEIDPVLFERAYYLVPGGQSTKAYRLLAQTMERAGRAGVATFVMRTREYVVAIIAEDGILRAETMRFADEIRTAKDIDLSAPKKAQAAAVKRMRSQIAKLAKQDIARSEMEDRNAERLLRVIERKRKKGEDVVETEVAEEVEEEKDIIDLMEVLRQRLAGKEKGTKSRGGGGLSRLSRKELYERAKKEDIEGRSEMTKTELVRALQRIA